MIDSSSARICLIFWWYFSYEVDSPFFFVVIHGRRVVSRGTACQVIGSNDTLLFANTCLDRGKVARWTLALPSLNMVDWFYRLTVSLWTNTTLHRSNLQNVEMNLKQHNIFIE